MKEKKATSYLDSIGSGHDAQGYDQEQAGKAHTEEVAPANNWGNDQRDAVGRAAYLSAKKKRIAKKLVRISRELEALSNLEENYSVGIEEMEGEPEDLTQKSDEAMAMEMGEETSENPDPEDSQSGDEWLDGTQEKEAAHPIEHRQQIGDSTDDPAANGSSQMGDDQWISIGPGTFSDQRDPVGRAGKN